MTQYRYSVTCSRCGEIEADTDDGLFSKATAHRRAGHHEGAFDHSCDVRIADETNEYRCSVCQALCVGEEERDDHAGLHPGVHPDSFARV